MQEIACEIFSCEVKMSEMKHKDYKSKGKKGQENLCLNAITERSQIDPCIIYITNDANRRLTPYTLFKFLYTTFPYIPEMLNEFISAISKICIDVCYSMNSCNI